MRAFFSPIRVLSLAALVVAGTLLLPASVAHADWHGGWHGGWGWHGGHWACCWRGGVFIGVAPPYYPPAYYPPPYYPPPYYPYYPPAYGYGG